MLRPRHSLSQVEITMSKRFVALDRDGTIIKECHYLSDPHLVELLPGAVDGLRHLRRLGLGLVVVTNQSGLGRGYFNQTTLDLIHQRFTDLLRQEDVELDGIYVCPHTPEDNCGCRKPRPGLVQAAVQEWGFEPHCCFVIGDNVGDIGLGQQIAATTFLVRTGYGAQVAAAGAVNPDYIVNNLAQAAEVIEDLLDGKEAIDGHNK